MGIAYRDHRIIRMEFLIYKLIGFSDGNNLVYAFAHFDVASHQLCLIAYHAYDGYLGALGKMGLKSFCFNQIGYFFYSLFGGVWLHDNDHLSSPFRRDTAVCPNLFFLISFSLKPVSENVNTLLL